MHGPPAHHKLGQQDPSAARQANAPANAGTVPAGSIAGWHTPLLDDTAGDAESSGDRERHGGLVHRLPRSAVILLAYLLGTV